MSIYLARLIQKNTGSNTTKYDYKISQKLSFNLCQNISNYFCNVNSKHVNSTLEVTLVLNRSSSSLHKGKTSPISKEW